MKKIPFALILLVLLIIACGVFFFVPYVLGDSDISFRTEQVTYLNDGWLMLERDGSLRGIDSLPTTVATAAGDTCVLTNTLSSDLAEASALCMRTSNQDIVIRLDGEVIYERSVRNTPSFGKTVGSSWNLIRLPQDAAGKPITVELTSPYEGTSGIVNEVFYGHKSACMYQLVHDCWFAALIGLMLIVAGILFFIYFLTIANGFDDDAGIFFLSFFATIIGIWVLGESKTLQLFISNAYINTSVAFVAVMLFPMPLVMYLDCVCKTHHHPMGPFFFFAYAVNFVVCLILQLLRVADFYETLLSTHILMVLTGAAYLASLINEYRRYKNTDARRELWTLCILVAFGFVDLLRFYTIQTNDSIRYFKLGVLLYVCILGYQRINEHRKRRRSSQEAKYYEKLAYTDFLTGGKNRTAYYSDIASLVTRMPTKRVWLVMLDIDNLKVINDIHGHAAGDQAIKDAYRAITFALECKNSCYRIGGDEFTAIVECLNEEEFLLRIAKLKDFVAEIDDKRDYEFGLSIGYEEYIETPEFSHERYFAIIDKKMYQDKIKKTPASGK